MPQGRIAKILRAPRALVTLPSDMDEKPTVSKQLLTVPNIVTLLRLAFVPVFLWLLFARNDRFGAALVLAALGATDWVDGWLARRLDQHSELGKALDPVADRLMFFVAIVAMIIDGSIPVWFAAAILVREVLVSVMAIGLEALGAPRLDVTWWGKAATFGMMFALPLLLGGHGDVGPTGLFTTMGWVIGIPSLAASYWALGSYGKPAKKALAEAFGSHDGAGEGQVSPPG